MNQFKIYTSANWLPKYRRVNIKQALPLYKLPKYTPLQARNIAKVDAGEDAFFLNSTTKHQYLGVADGVGSWEKVGVDPAQVSWSLMNNASAIIKNNRTSLGSNTDLSCFDLLHQAYNMLLEDNSIIAGSSTASILKINKDNGELNGVNLGDSSFLVIRDRTQIVYKSKEQQHFFNCPYQLSIIPKDLALDNVYIKNQPSDCDKIDLKLQNNDLVILATDGYFDNVFDEETIAIVQNELIDFKRTNDLEVDLSQAKAKGFHNLIPTDNINININKNNNPSLELKIRKLSQKLAETARKHSLNTRRISPWSNQLLKNHAYCEPGGKLDDITVLVALIQKAEDN